jgi:signal transduction histidine kinase
METALASFPEPIFILNTKGQVELRNPAATELCEKLQTRDCLPPAVEDLAKSVFESGRDYRPNNFQAAIHFAERQPARFFLPRAVTMRHRENALIGVAVVLFDVPRFRLLDDAKSNLVATVSHELKTPLTSVLMALHLLADQNFGVLNAKQLDLVTTARDNAERLLRILNDLLDLNRLEEGSSSLVRESASPADIVRCAVCQIRDALTGRGTRLLTSVDPNLPDLKVDTQRLNHVFSSLVSNALKFSPANGTICIRAMRADHDSVQFSVTDEGPGVPSEFRHRIFDRFFRIPGQPASGAGLGLSIAREIVLAHGGRIGLRCAPGHGSEFYFILPGDSHDNGLEPHEAKCGSPPGAQ